MRRRVVALVTLISEYAVEYSAWDEVDVDEEDLDFSPVPVLEDLWVVLVVRLVLLRFGAVELSLMGRVVALPCSVASWFSIFISLPASASLRNDKLPEAAHPVTAPLLVRGDDRRNGRTLRAR